MERTCLATENRPGPCRTKHERRVLRAERQLARAVSKQACSHPSILRTFFVLPGPGADFERPLLPNRNQAGRREANRLERIQRNAPAIISANPESHRRGIRLAVFGSWRASTCSASVFTLCGVGWKVASSAAGTAMIKTSATSTSSPLGFSALIGASFIAVTPLSDELCAGCVMFEARLLGIDGTDCFEAFANSMARFFG